MLSSFRAAFFTLALILSVLRCYPLRAQDPVPQTAPTPPTTQQDPSASQQTAPPITPQAAPPTVPQDVPPPKPGEVVRPWQPGDPEPKGPLQIVVIDGQDGVNVVKKKASAPPVVEIRDGNNSPIAGASVTFSAPGDGPSVTFSNKLRSISVLTDDMGRTTLEKFRPLSLGQFQVTVEATFRSLSATSTISMTNVLKAEPKDKPGTVGASHGSGMSGKTIGILVGVAAAAAIGIGVGLSHHASTASTAASTTATIGAGSGGSVGVPH